VGAGCRAGGAVGSAREAAAALVEDLVQEALLTFAPFALVVLVVVVLGVAVAAATAPAVAALEAAAPAVFGFEQFFQFTAVEEEPSALGALLHRHPGEGLPYEGAGTFAAGDLDHALSASAGVRSVPPERTLFPGAPQGRESPFLTVSDMLLSVHKVVWKRSPTRISSCPRSPPGVPVHRPPDTGGRGPARALAALTALTLCAAGAAALGGPVQAAAGCRVDYTVNQWNTGFTGNVTVTNFGGPVDGWTLRWTFPAGERLSQGWNAEFSSSGADVTAANTAWNAAIPTGGTVSFGFNATHTGTVGVPQNFSLNGVSCAGPGDPRDPEDPQEPHDPEEPEGPGEPTAPSDPTGARQAERLDRGLISVRSGNGNLVSWRLLGSDPHDV